MSPEDYAKFRHDAVHALMRLNDSCEREFQLSSWPRWHYDLEETTLEFLKDDIPRVVASIQVVGTTSRQSGTWLWGWANGYLPTQATKAIKEVREFGERESVAELTTRSLTDDEYLGWEMTSIAAEILRSKGAYRCPDENGFLYVVYTDISFAVARRPKAEKQIECGAHGAGYETFVCEHLVSNPAQRWFSDDPTEENRWPDSWCAACEALYQEQGEWNERNSSSRRIRLLCHHCYESLRSRSQPGNE